MPRRQILSSEEQECLLVIPDDEIILTRMCFLNEPDIALINKHRRPVNRHGFNRHLRVSPSNSACGGLSPEQFENQNLA